MVPYAVSGLGNGARLEQTVGVSQTALDAGILAVNVEDAALQCTRRCDRVCAQNHHVGRVEVDAEHRVGNFAQQAESKQTKPWCQEFLDSDVLNAALLAVCDKFVPKLDGHLPTGTLISRRPRNPATKR